MSRWVGGWMDKRVRHLPTHAPTYTGDPTAANLSSYLLSSFSSTGGGGGGGDRRGGATSLELHGLEREEEGGKRLTLLPPTHLSPAEEGKEKEEEIALPSSTQVPNPSTHPPTHLPTHPAS